MSTLTKDGGPAFPARVASPTTCEDHHGMSLRDWFAGQALAGLLSQEDKRTWGGIPIDEDGIRKWRNELLTKDAEICYQAADAMLAAREEKK